MQLCRCTCHLLCLPSSRSTSRLAPSQRYLKPYREWSRVIAAGQSVCDFQCFLMFSFSLHQNISELKFKANRWVIGPSGFLSLPLRKALGHWVMSVPPTPGFSFLTWITRLLNLGRLPSRLTAHDFTFCEYYFQCFRNLHRKFEGWFPFFPFLLHLKFWLWFCGISTKPLTASCLWKSLLSCEYGPHFTFTFLPFE